MAVSRAEILKRLQAQHAAGKPIVGCGAGTGISAKMAEAGGCDLIIIYNSGRYRMAGRGSLAGLLSYGDANGIVVEMAAEVLPIVKNVPVLAGVNGTDPFRLMPVFLKQLKDIGFSGVQNFPTVGLIDGNFRANLEATGATLEGDLFAGNNLILGAPPPRNRRAARGWMLFPLTEADMKTRLADLRKIKNEEKLVQEVRKNSVRTTENFEVAPNTPSRWLEITELAAGRYRREIPLKDFKGLFEKYPTVWGLLVWEFDDGANPPAAISLKLPDASADAVFLWDVYQFLPTAVQPRLLLRLHRLMAPEARLLAIFQQEGSGATGQPHICRILDPRTVQMTPRSITRPLAGLSNRAVERDARFGLAHLLFEGSTLGLVASA